MREREREELTCSCCTDRNVVQIWITFSETGRRKYEWMCMCISFSSVTIGSLLMFQLGAIIPHWRRGRRNKMFVQYDGNVVLSYLFILREHISPLIAPPLSHTLHQRHDLCSVEVWVHGTLAHFLFMWTLKMCIKTGRWMSLWIPTLPVAPVGSRPSLIIHSHLAGVWFSQAPTCKYLGA